MAVRRLRLSAAATAAVWTAWAVSASGDPAYYAPAALADHVASILGQLGFVGNAVTLFLWAAASPPRRTVRLVQAAGVGYALWAVGNLLEESLRLEFGVWVFFVGGTLSFVATLAAGIVTLAVRSPWRWTGAVLLGVLLSLSLEWLPLLAPLPWVVLALRAHVLRPVGSAGDA